MSFSHLPSNLERLAQKQKILLLQGPIGVFFQHLSDWLGQRGCQVWKLNFNAADAFFYPKNPEKTVNYDDALAQFDDFLRDFIVKNQIDAVVCFGDNRPYHRVAKNVCQTLPETSFWVFEEGYFRPFWITLEQDGVNDFSPLPRNIDFFVQHFDLLKEKNQIAEFQARGGFLPMAQNAMIYYAIMYWKNKDFPNYQHHRFHEIGHYLKLWIKSGIKRAWYAIAERWFMKKIQENRYGRFFVLPLQVFNDSQIRVHSDFSTVRDFLLHVLLSFAKHAPSNTQLLIKHHPMDRGFVDYHDDIQDFIAEHPHLIGRVHYFHDVPLPIFLRHGVGMVTLNSTSGISALIHKMPVKVLGRAHYDMAGLTDQQPLAEFWHNPQPPNMDYFHAYRMYHLNITQIGGSFYSEVNLPK